MTTRTTFLCLVIVNVLIAAGDYYAKRAVAQSERDLRLTIAAMVLWFVACCGWLPVMRSRGFTKLVALADVLGLVMLAVVGRLFLDERLGAREWTGIGFAVAAIALLGAE